MTHVLAHDDDEQVCTDCAHALGAVPPPHAVAWSLSVCCLCGDERSTTAICDWDWPGSRPVDARGITARSAEEVQG